MFRCSEVCLTQGAADCSGTHNGRIGDYPGLGNFRAGSGPTNLWGGRCSGCIREPFRLYLRGT